MPKNRLLIQWDNDVLKNVGERMFVERESFKCNTIESAQKILSRRVGTKMQFAKFYNEYGIETVMQLPKKKIKVLTP